MKVLILLCLTLLTTHCIKLPRTLKKCDRHQSNFKNCLFAAVQDAINKLNNRSFPKLRLPNLNPIEFSELAINSTGRLVRIQEILKDCKFYGAHDFKLRYFDFDFVGKQMEISGESREVRSACTYFIDGSILGSRVYGTGKSSITLQRTNISLVTNYAEVKRSNKTYANFISAKVKTDKPGNIIFNLENLFGGDKQLSDRTNALLNENWSELFDDISTEYFHLGHEMVLKILNQIFQRISLEELFNF